MRTQILTFVCLLGAFFNHAQNDDVQTKSVLIDNLITFIVEHIETKDSNVTQDPEHLIFLLQTPVGDLNPEDKVIFKQAFKLVSNKLTASDHVSIIAYSGMNGMALNKASAKDLKDLLFTIENLKSSIKDPKRDGMELAYTFAESSNEADGNCTIIMVRNPKTMIARSDTTNPVQSVNSTDKPNKGNAVLLTAISLLPQLISVIKD